LRGADAELVDGSRDSGLDEEEVVTGCGRVDRPHVRAAEDAGRSDERRLTVGLIV
jgi:hypothetical protein